MDDTGLSRLSPLLAPCANKFQTLYYHFCEHRSFSQTRALPTLSNKECHFPVDFKKRYGSESDGICVVLVERISFD